MSIEPHGEPESRDRVSLARFTDALSAAGVWHRVRGDHLDFRCPLPEHTDRDASGSADWRPGRADRPGAVRLLCHACGPAATPDVVAALGLTMADLFDDLPRRPSGSRARPAGSGRAMSRRAGAVTPARSAVRMTEKSAAPARDRGRLIARHVYADADGVVVGECARYELAPATPGGKPGKRFAWRYQGPAGGWVYRCPDGVPLYRLPEVLAAVAAGRPVWLVEGERNVDDLAALGHTATTAPNGSRRGWNPAYTARLAGAAVTIVADRDDPGYAHAADVAAALAPVAGSVRIVRTPLETPGADVSDHLAAGLELDALEPIPAAVLPVGVVDVDEHGTVPVARVLPFPTPDAGFDVDEQDGPGPGPVAVPDPRRRRRRGDGGGTDGGDGSLVRVRDQFGQMTGEDVQVSGDVGRWAVVQIKTNADGHRQAVELLNASVRLVRRVAVDAGDGTPVGTTHVDLVAERAGERIELHRVPWDDFRKGVYLSRLPWPLVWRDTPQGRSALANAITETSGPVPVEVAYGTLGWREHPGAGWVYAHAGGGIGAAGSVPAIEVEVSPRLRTFTLPAPPVDAAGWAPALAGVLDVLDVLPARVVAPVLAAPLRAIVGGPACRASVFVVGHTGSRKSGVAALAQQVHCPTARHNRLPVGAGESATTITAMEELLWQSADALLVADDLAPDRGAERSAARANELLRLVGNGSPKARGARSGGLREDRPPRAVLMLTGEDGASRPSAESRTVYVPLAPGDVELDAIRSVSGRDAIAGRGLAGSGLARFVAARLDVDGLDGWSAHVEALTASYSAALLEADPDPDGLASRRADAVAELAAGWRVWLDAALDAGALQADAAGAVWSRVWAGLVEALALQVEVTERRDVAARAADLLRSALVSGRAHLEAAHGGSPDHALQPACGWTRGGSEMYPDVRAGGERVGWVQGGRVWLDPGATFAVIERQARSESDPLGITARALTGALVAAGVLATVSVAGRARPVPQVRRPVLGRSTRVWDAPWSWVWPDDVDTAPGPVDPAPANPSPAGGSAPAPNITPPDGPADSLSGAESAPDGLAASGAANDTSPSTQAVSARSVARSRQDRVEVSDALAARYVARGVVVDVDAAYLIGGGPLDPPTADSLAAVVEWAAALSLGTAHAASRDDAGQVWIMPTLARRLGLARCPDPGTTRALTTHPAVQTLLADGWSVGRRGLQPWTHVFRDGARSLQVVTVPWLREDVLCSSTRPPAVDVLAARLDLYATVAGMGAPGAEPRPYLVSAASTGIALLRQVRGTARERLDVVTPPDCALSDRWVREFAWQRPLSPDEVSRGHLEAWDVNAQYLAASALALVGVGEVEHVEAPTFDLTTATGRRAVPVGYWRVRDVPELPADMPSLLADPDDDGSVITTTPILVALAEHGIVLRPVEGWAWSRGTRWMQGWAETLRDARYALAKMGDDSEIRSVETAIKLTYSATIGRTGSQRYQEGTTEFRPDARHMIIDTAKANLYRKCAKAKTAGQAPVLVMRDTVVFASTEPAPAAPPTGFKATVPGDIARLGQVKPTGSATLDSALIEAFAATASPSLATLGRITGGEA